MVPRYTYIYTVMLRACEWNEIIRVTRVETRGGWLERGFFEVRMRERVGKKVLYFAEKAGRPYHYTRDYGTFSAARWRPALSPCSSLLQLDQRCTRMHRLIVTRARTHSDIQGNYYAIVRFFFSFFFADQIEH